MRFEPIPYFDSARKDRSNRGGYAHPLRMLERKEGDIRRSKSKAIQVYWVSCHMKRGCVTWVVEHEKSLADVSGVVDHILG